MATESSPLLASVEPNVEHETVNESVDKRSLFQKKRFWALAAWGMMFIIGFNLTFLPRTSLSRDFRRMHGVKLTRADVKRDYLATLSKSNHAREWLKKYTNQPHMAGQGYELVEFTKNKFQEFGFETSVEQYDIWLNRPVDNHLKLLNENDEVVYIANLEEDILEEDDTTGLEGSIPAFHGYSANGNVTAEFVYVNYATREDFAELDKKGVNVTGKIAIARYGAIFRGLKVKFAQENGAIGVVLYSDPFDDGEVTIANGYEAYPKGKARNPSSLQRGSVQYFTDNPGDPTTPGYASKKGCKREDPSKWMPHIPSLPISYRSIAPILKQLNNGYVNMGWKGGVDGFDYSPGPSATKVNLYNLQDYKITPIYNVMGKIQGILPGEEIIIGNHRDAWIIGGAGDPNSGTAVMMEVARAFQSLLKLGWKPLRTITFASWDGEEYAMLGSTEFAEDHHKRLNSNAFVYLNLDIGVAGSAFYCQSNPLFNDAIRTVAKTIPFKGDSGYSLFDYWEAQNNATIGVLGSGTDFAVFQNHLAIPSISMEFGSNGVTDAVYHYHSNYDSFHWMDTFIDPDYSLHNTMAKFLGLLLVDLSEHEMAHVSTSSYTKDIGFYFDTLKSEIPGHWLTYPVDIGAKSGESDQTTFQEVLEGFEAQINRMIEASKTFDAYSADIQDALTTDYPWFKLYKKIALMVQIKMANYKIMALDRIFLTKEGLNNRDWMKHSIYAPHRDLGYSGDILPGFHEALMDKNFEDTLKWIQILTRQFKVIEKKLS